MTAVGIVEPRRSRMPTVLADRTKQIEGYDWQAIARDLDAHGWALIPRLLGASECAAIAGLYPDDRRFRSHVVMARHGFGRGEYKYFSYPLPETLGALRTALYPR